MSFEQAYQYFLKEAESVDYNEEECSLGGKIAIGVFKRISVGGEPSDKQKNALEKCYSYVNKQPQSIFPVEKYEIIVNALEKDGCITSDNATTLKTLLKMKKKLNWSDFDRAIQ